MLFLGPHLLRPYLLELNQYAEAIFTDRRI